jgi:hypothetical protein
MDSLDYILKALFCCLFLRLLIKQSEIMCIKICNVTMKYTLFIVANLEKHFICRFKGNKKKFNVVEVAF